MGSAEQEARRGMPRRRAVEWRELGRRAGGKAARELAEEREEPRGELEEPRGELGEPQEALEELREALEELREALEEPRGELEEPRGELEEPRGELGEPQEALEELRGGAVAPHPLVRRRANNVGARSAVTLNARFGDYRWGISRGVVPTRLLEFVA